ncbi:phage holin family protein [Flavobacterium sp. NRK1]|uniref:phage holin family protein n=1 Tax=Flavobacterium sp. NRK1 TaxID=2954929 RepID=UPI0020927D57|nr:phage holin family protein [Flavobacterium sp. NRK1]MCO6147534.1 phage holin family protein [Flavobacterium sp. NRK1]
MNLSIFFNHLIKPFITAKIVLNKPDSFTYFLPAIVIPVLTTPQKAIILLGLFFTLDFITGICASYIEFKKNILPLPGSEKQYVLQSAKLRLSVIKFITYGLAIIIAYAIEWTFIIGEFEPHSKLQKMTLTTFVIAFCCTIEIYSIFFENIKRMGFDIIQKVKNISKEGWKLYKTITNDNNNTSNN